MPDAAGSIEDNAVVVKARTSKAKAIKKAVSTPKKQKLKFGICDECHKSVLLAERGVVYDHWDTRASKCPGSGKNSVGALIDRYQTEGWDQQSSIDIVWESVTRRCPEYLGAMKKAARTYGDSS